MALASGAGILDSSVYSRETASWAAQGVGQDLVNLFVACPALLITAHYLNKGSVRAFLVWLGILIYTIYSYLLYAFFVHFNSWFLVYVAVLGLSFYTLLGGCRSLKQDELSRFFAGNTQARRVSIFLFVFGLLFSFLWLADIVQALLAGRAPEAVREIGLPVNPVHVLDLAFVLPGMIIASVLLWKKRLWGFLWAAPLLVFSAIMGIAIISMSYVMDARGTPAPFSFVLTLAAVVLISLYLAYKFLKETRVVKGG